jgi:hypothetical protein
MRPLFTVLTPPSPTAIELTDAGCIKVSGDHHREKLAQPSEEVLEQQSRSFIVRQIDAIEQMKPIPAVGQNRPRPPARKEKLFYTPSFLTRGFLFGLSRIGLARTRRIQVNEQPYALFNIGSARRISGQTKRRRVEWGALPQVQRIQAEVRRLVLGLPGKFCTSGGETNWYGRSREWAERKSIVRSRS